MAQDFQIGDHVKAQEGVTGKIISLKSSFSKNYIIIRDDGNGWELTQSYIDEYNIDPIYLNNLGAWNVDSRYLMLLEQPIIPTYIPSINDRVWIDLYKTHARVISKVRNDRVYVIREDNLGYSLAPYTYVQSVYQVDTTYPIDNVFCIPINNLEKSNLQFPELILELKNKKSSPEEKSNKSLTKSKLLEPIPIKKRILI